MADRSEKLAHLFPTGVTSPKPFTTPRTPRDPDRATAFPRRADPVAHAQLLQRELKAIGAGNAHLIADRQAALVEDCAGTFVDVKFVPSEDFPLKSHERAKIELS